MRQEVYQNDPRLSVFCTHGDAASGRTKGAACPSINSVNMLLGLALFSSDIGVCLTGSGGFNGLDDCVGARFEDAADAAFLGDADPCGFAGASGNTVERDSEELELQGSHPILPSKGRSGGLQSASGLMIHCAVEEIKPIGGVV